MRLPGRLVGGAVGSSAACATRVLDVAVCACAPAASNETTSNETKPAKTAIAAVLIRILTPTQAC
jgi:hypothetical protein